MAANAIKRLDDRPQGRTRTQVGSLRIIDFTMFDLYNADVFSVVFRQVLNQTPPVPTNPVGPPSQTNAPIATEPQPSISRLTEQEEGIPVLPSGVQTPQIHPQTEAVSTSPTPENISTPHSSEPIIINDDSSASSLAQFSQLEKRPSLQAEQLTTSRTLMNDPVKTQTQTTQEPPQVTIPTTEQPHSSPRHTVQYDPIGTRLPYQSDGEMSSEDEEIITDQVCDQPQRAGPTFTSPDTWYSIECILRHRRRRGRDEYLVQWSDESDPTWVDRSNVSNGAMQHFYANHKRRRRVR